MRLTNDDIAAINAAGASDAVVRRFGSRVDDARKGNAIDLHRALGAFEDAGDRADAVRVRNERAHEYPLQPAEQSARIAAARYTCATLGATQRLITAFVVRERLMHGGV